MNNSYELVKLHRNAPISVEDIKFAGNKITKACRYYLIGKLIEQEKQNRNLDETLNDLLARIGKDVGYAGPSASRACTYVKAIECLEKCVPDIVPLIIEGQARLSMENTITLSNKTSDEIRAVIEKLSDETVRIHEIFPGHLSHSPENRHGSKHNEIPATVKDTPEYDPDAQVSSLAYTIPSWVSTIDKVFMNTDFTQISTKARYKFRKELNVLMSTAEAILGITKEDK